MKRTIEMLVAVVAWCAGALLAAATAADVDAGVDENRHLWAPRTTSVAVFKQDLGFFMREGDVDLRDGWCATKQVPPAAFGTLAIYSHAADEVVDIVGSGPGEIVEFDGRDLPDDDASRRARLEASTNLNVLLSYTYKDTSRQAAGRLVSVGDEFVVLDGPDNTFAVPLGAITRMQVLDLPVRIHVSSDTKKPPESTTLGMAYLRKGVTWIPEYTLTVLDEETAELTLRGTFINEAEDLVHCDIHFVVGVPHFAHTDYMAPIAVGQVIRTIGAGVAPAQVRTQLMNRAAITSNTQTAEQFGIVDRAVADAGGSTSGALGNLPQMGGPGGTDYTVYTMKDMTVRRGERAIVTLFVKKITYSHAYRWAPPGRMEHFLVLHNRTETAWTTGPCLAVSAQRPLSEDLLRYTPKGGDCEIPVTAAVNIAHEKSESETDRKLKTYSPSHDFYVDLVTLDGTLKVRNFEKRDVHITIDVDVPGKPLSASDNGTVVVNTTKLALMERCGSIHWRITLKPSETKTLTYSYERYVPSR